MKKELEAMTDEEWEQRRDRAISAAFQTGRPVFADTDGKLRYADGDREPIAADVGVVEDSPAKEPPVKESLPRAPVWTSWWSRVKRWLGASERR